MNGRGQLYATCVLRPFAEQLLSAAAPVRGASFAVLGGDGGLLSAVLRARGAEVRLLDRADLAPPGSHVLALGTLGIAAAPATSLRRIVQAGASLSAVHFTVDSQHEMLAHRALEAVGAAAADPWLAPVPPAALADYETSTIHDVVRFESARQFMAALIGERNLDAGLSVIDRRRLLDACETALRPFTAYDDTVVLPVGALLITRRAS